MRCVMLVNVKDEVRQKHHRHVFLHYSREYCFMCVMCKVFVRSICLMYLTVSRLSDEEALELIRASPPQGGRRKAPRGGGRANVRPWLRNTLLYSL